VWPVRRAALMPNVIQLSNMQAMTAAAQRIIAVSRAHWGLEARGK
jgi:hypothetical protein